MCPPPPLVVSSPWGRRETGRDYVPEGLAVPLEAQGWEEFPVGKRRAQYVRWLCPAQQTCHSQGRNSFLRLFCRVRPRKGQRMYSNEELPLPEPLPIFPLVLQEKPSGPEITVAH